MRYTYRTLLTAMIEFYLELTDSLPTFFDRTTNLGEETDGRRLGLGEHIDVVGSHTLLSDEDLLRTVDDEVSSRIVRTLIQIEQLLVSQTMKDTVGRPEHNWNLPHGMKRMTWANGLKHTPFQSTLS